MKPKRKHIRITLDPYPGVLYLTTNKAEFIRLATRLSKMEVLDKPEATGRCLMIDQSPRIYVAWSETSDAMVHEMAHVVLDMFDCAGIDPVASNGEPFCYMLGSIVSRSGFFTNGRKR
jgi:hypothetical protein